MRRLFWLAVGLGAGVTLGLSVTRWARQKTEQLAPASLGRQAGAVARDLGALLREAAEEFRAGVREREAELRGLVEATLAEEDTRREPDEDDEGWPRTRFGRSPDRRAGEGEEPDWPALPTVEVGGRKRRESGPASPWA